MLDGRLRQGLNRRRLLWGLTSAAFVILAGTSLPYVKSWRHRRVFANRTRGEPDTTDFPRQDLLDIAWFTTRLFGHTPTRNDESEIVWRLDYLAKEDREWRPLFQWLVQRIEALNEDSATTRFNALPEAKQQLIFDDILNRQSSVMGRKGELLALISDEWVQERAFFRFTLNKLNAIYVHSGVPWRRRGYTSWPGIPGDPRNYTIAGPQRQC